MVRPLLPSLLLLGACTPQQDEIEALTRTYIGPGEHAAVRLDPVDGTSEVVDPGPDLTGDSVTAVQTAPDWIHGPLSIRLGMLEPALQDEIAALVLREPDLHVVDELAFTIAHLTELDLENDDLDLDGLVDGISALYQVDRRLDYVEIVDQGTPNDWHSTLRYTWLDGEDEATWELSPELYYWWVVHPRLDVEDPVPIDPADGEPAPPPTGVSWRRYVMDSSEQTFDYRDHHLLREPNDLREVDLVLDASAHLVEPTVYPLRVFVDEADHGLLVEVDLGGGTVLATTLDLAWAAADGEVDLPENVWEYGNTNLSLGVRDVVAVVRDDVPWGSEVHDDLLSPITDLVTAAELSTLVLSGYDKILVASDQDRAFYQAVAAHNEALDEYVRGGGVLELDLYTDADLSGVEFVAGVAVEGAAPTDVHAEGQPLLGDWIPQAEYLWDGVAQPGLSGDRPPDPDETALGLIGWVVSQNMYDNISERYAATGSPPERSWYPQRILHNHYGNCGELADLLGAAGRASLIPVRTVGSVEDHTWNEVWFRDRWVPWQVDWSDGPTRIDNPAVAADQEYGGGKTLSGMFAYRGDGWIDNPVAVYTDTATLELSVEDEAGRPVDGAMVVLATEAYYDPEQLTFAHVTYTDATGRASIEVGNDRNYWFWVYSELGGGVEFPSDGDPEEITVSRLARDSQTGAGEVVERLVRLEAAAVVPEAGEAGGGEGRLDLSANATGSWLVAPGFFLGGHVIEESATEGVRWYLLDEEAWDALQAGEPFDALATAEGAAGIEAFGAEVPLDEPVWLVAVNTTAAHEIEVDLWLAVPVE